MAVSAGRSIAECVSEVVVRIKVRLEEVMKPGVIIMTMTVLVVSRDFQKGLKLYKFLYCHGKGSW